MVSYIRVATMNTMQPQGIRIYGPTQTSRGVCMTMTHILLHVRMHAFANTNTQVTSLVATKVLPFRELVATNVYFLRLRFHAHDSKACH